MVDLAPFLCYWFNVQYITRMHTGCYMLTHLLTTSFQIGPLPGSQGNARVKVRAQLNLHGIFSIDSAIVSRRFYFSIFCYKSWFFLRHLVIHKLLCGFSWSRITRIIIIQISMQWMLIVSLRPQIVPTLLPMALKIVPISVILHRIM